MFLDIYETFNMLWLNGGEKNKYVGVTDCLSEYINLFLVYVSFCDLIGYGYFALKAEVR